MNAFYSEQMIQNKIDDELYAILPVVEQVRNLHAKGRYGFDICPENIVMTRHGALLRMKSISLSASGASVFRAGYTPRERYMSGAVGPWTDVYAVCALVYTAMTGLMLPSAFERGHADPLFGGLNEKYRELEDVVTQGLAIDMTQRLQSLDSLLEQIQECLLDYNPPGAKHTDKTRKPMNRKRAACAILITILLLLSGAVIVNEVNYAQAVSHAEAGDYTLAQKSLKGVFQFYKDAAQLSDYTNAGVAFENGAYGAAALGFSELSGYRGANEMVRETDYRHAHALIQQGSFAEAKELLKTLGKYKDSSQMLLQIDYEKGVMFLEAGLYLSALEAFQSISGYGDAALRAEEARGKLYGAAISALSAGDTDTAVKYFAAIPDYEQADELKKLTVLLAQVQNGEEVTLRDYSFIVRFADTVDLSRYLMSDALIGYYLQGSWQDEEGSMFEMDNSGGIQYNISEITGESYSFSGDVLYIGAEAVFRFSFVNINTVEIFVYVDDKTYVMTRQ